jgi:hypothetical protein
LHLQGAQLRAFQILVGRKESRANIGILKVCYDGCLWLLLNIFRYCFLLEMARKNSLQSFLVGLVLSLTVTAVLPTLTAPTNALIGSGLIGTAYAALPPPTITQSSVSGDTFSVSWSPMAAVDKAPQDKYVLQFSQSTSFPNGAGATLTYNVLPPSTTFSQKFADGQWYFRMKGYDNNAAGKGKDGPWSNTIAFVIDVTGPKVTGTPDRAPDDSVNGWYTAPVTITWTGNDGSAGTGIKSCDSPTTYSGPDGLSIVITGHCVDNADNIGTGSITVNYNAGGSITPSPSPSYSLSKTHSGLVSSDSLTRGNLNSQQLKQQTNPRWFFDGSAVVQGAPYEYYEDTADGLHLGVEALAAGQWAGFFAVTPDLNAQLYHAVLTLPYNSISDNSFDTGLYVQTTNGLINYVTCAGMATPSGSFWAVVSTTGNFDQATSFETLWSDYSAGQPKTRDCTIITNGDNFLQVYLDNRLVYSSSNLKLQMPAPFNAFLEVQTSSPTSMLYSTYKDFYSADGPNISIVNAPAGGTVKIVRSGSVIASATIGSDGKASMDLGKYHFPLSATIQVYGSDKTLVTSTSSDVAIWGGDVYSVSDGSATTTTTQSTTTATTSDTTTSNKKVGAHVLPPSLFEHGKQ